MTSVAVPTLFSSTPAQFNILPQSALEYCVLFGKNVQSQITNLAGLTVIGSSGYQFSNNATLQNNSQLSTMVTTGNTFNIGDLNTVIGNVGYPESLSTPTTTSGTNNVVIVAALANFSQPFQNNMVLISTKHQRQLNTEIGENVVRINTSAFVLPGLRAYSSTLPAASSQNRAIMVDRNTGRLVKIK